MSIELSSPPIEFTDRGQSPFVIDDHSLIYISDTTMEAAAQYLLGLLDEDYDIQMIDANIHMNSGILFTYDSDLDQYPQGGFIIDIHSSHITISAAERGGLWNAVQMMDEILPSSEIDIKNSALPSVTILDYPTIDIEN
ncbi:glycoside hydrolase family 20 zincin-like fold domain-containing protein [Membranihabitans marinus]|uniref:glycoside hydrolase family 20 zincin-like fold domain-containing protein n=1 Tax=Membranihabitans marinus TaxID=1227546 RepID=UPI001F31D05E|nr:glycoside hydrolase family 20 zincin-like fold domain-containing protein [Membranihabitans marinus]